MKHFDEVYQAYFSDVFFYLRRLCRDASLAEELTGETFFKAMSAIDRFRGECDVRVWLCQIARNTYFSYRRKHPDNAQPLDDALPDPAPSPETRVIHAQDRLRLHALVHALPEPYREVFTLRVWGELSFAEIGTLFDKSANWACVTYHRARQKMQIQLTETSEMEEPPHD